MAAMQSSTASKQASMAPVSTTIVPFPKPPARRGEYELAFLPAALEIAETPPSPIGRAIGATIIALFCAALAWASLGSVDVVATAPGKIIPTGRTKLTQPFETGVVRAIHVHDGQSVKAGDVLIELDPTMTEAEQGHMKSDLMATELEVARLRAALAGGTDPVAEYHPPAGASPAQVEMQRQFLISQSSEQNAKLAEIARQQSQKEAERETTAASIGKLQATIPVLQERVDVRKYLFDKALGSKLTYLTDYQDLIGQQQDLAIQQSRLREADAAIAALRETREKTAAEHRRTLFDALATAEQKAAGAAQDAITRDKPPDRSNDKTSQGSEASTSEPKGQELAYSARVSLDRAQMDVDGKLVKLGPGMAVTVEMKTGSRRIISYLISPLVRYKHEVLRER